MSLADIFEPLDRSLLLSSAHKMQGPLNNFYRMIQNAPDEIMQRSLIVLWNWGRHGYQSIEMPHTYMAALMATDASAELLQGQRLPWPALEIQVPPGLIKSSHGEVFNVMISEVPNEVTLRGQIEGAKYFVTYNDAISTATQTFDSLESLANRDMHLDQHSFMTDALAAVYNKELEDRIWTMLLRLLANTILLINTARIDKPTVYPKLPARELKHGKPRTNVHRLGTVLAMDCRPSIRSFVNGSTRNEPSITTLVRGHWRNQAHGPKWSLHRSVWLQPFYRGDGPLSPHVTKIKPPTENPAPTK